MIVNILEDITPALAARVLGQVQANTDKEITVNIMSHGGDMLAGNAIMSALKMSPATVTTKVFGIAASMAAAISQVGSTRLIAEDAIFQPHNGAAIPNARPTKEVLGQVTEALAVMDDMLIKAFSKSNLNEDALRALLIEDKPISAAEAVKMGFFDNLMEPIRAAAYLNNIKMKDENVLMTKLKEIKALFLPKADEHLEPLPAPAVPGEEVAPAEAPVTRAEFEKLVALVEQLMEQMSPLPAPSVEEQVTGLMDKWLVDVKSTTVIPEASATALPKPEAKPEDDFKESALDLRKKEIQSKFEKTTVKK